MNSIDTRIQGLQGLGIRASTYLRLGPLNLARVLLYRLGLRLGIHPVTRIGASIGDGDFFDAPKGGLGGDPGTIGQRLTPSQAWKEKGLYFGWYPVSLTDGVPQWHGNPFTGLDVSNPQCPWWQIPDFDPGLGDIKAIWEPSRFDWVLPMAQRVKLGNHGELKRLNTWLRKWCRANPPYRGPNWKCGQEASIRVMHLAVASRLLGQRGNTQAALRDLIVAHLKRIYPTVSYAMAQDNNHGTSEGAALFIGGHWCRHLNVPEAPKWARVGRRLLENRVGRLIQVDGSFSQHSVNYHRLVLDTLSIAELWRRWNGLGPFSSKFYRRARAATYWLYDLVNPSTGDAPNLGANDGARLLPLTDSDYRDYRPTVQLAMALFAKKSAYGDTGYHSHQLIWLGVKRPPDAARATDSIQRDQGGYTILRKGPWMALLKYPRYRFRPGHCDALHVDLSHGPKNLLRDGGSFSYNTEPPWQDYFPSVASHNTVQFDDRNQMPRLGRFLYGAWLKAQGVMRITVSEGSFSAGAAYRDWWNAFHHRHITLSAEGLEVRDRLDGFEKRAVLRWRLMPGDWELDGYSVRLYPFELRVDADMPIHRFELVQGWESRYYGQKTRLPVLEVEVHRPGTLVTYIACHGSEEDYQ